MEAKTCFKCGTEKPLDQFYRHPKMADGRLNKCKPCNREDVRQNRLKKIKYYREYDRSRGSRTNYDRQKAKNLAEPKKYKARYTLTNAVRDGRIHKPSSCEKCGAIGRIHGHHEDYSKPLEVMWLCVPCHKQRHKELGWGYIWNEGMDRAG